TGSESAPKNGNGPPNQCLGSDEKPEPCSNAGKEHQCLVGLSLPSPISFSQTCQVAPVSAARDVPARNRPLLQSPHDFINSPWTGIITKIRECANRPALGQNGRAFRSPAQTARR